MKLNNNTIAIIPIKTDETTESGIHLTQRFTDTARVVAVSDDIDDISEGNIVFYKRLRNIAEKDGVLYCDVNSIQAVIL